MDTNLPIEGSCACGQARYRLESPPLFVHCCHCSRCQRETGAAFALNILIESSQTSLLSGQLEKITVPTASDRGQVICRCSECHVALWSNYAGAGDKINFVKAGTLEDPQCCPPDIHIYTSTKLEWLELTDGKPVHDHNYLKNEEWPAASLERYRVELNTTQD